MRGAFIWQGNRQWLGWLIGLIPLSGMPQQIVIDSVVSPVMYYTNRLAPFRVSPVRDTVKLRQNQNYVFVHFHHSAPYHMVEYQLAGLESCFILTKNDYIYYSNIPEGQYVLIIRDKNNPGIAKRLVVEVEALFWQKWWFSPLVFVLACMLAGIIFYFFYLYKLRQQIHLQQTRDRIARDLHDDMGSYLSSISILSRSAANATHKDPDRARQSIDRIGQTARQVMGAMSDIVWSINPQHDSMPHVVARMQDVANELIAETDIFLRFEADTAVLSLNLSLEQRHDFFMVYKEALTNAVRYSEASQVHVHLTCEAEKNSSFGLRLTIRDNGRGFNVAQPQARSGGGNGLRNMHARAIRLGATITVESEPGQGTTIQLK